MSTFPTFADYDICKEALAKLQELGLENPADLAFAFTGLEQASALGVGAAWMVVHRDAKAFAHTACVQWEGCKPSTGHIVQSGNVTPKAEVKACDRQRNARSQKRRQEARARLKIAT